MFTGIVEDTGEVLDIGQRGEGLVLEIDTGSLDTELETGDSVSINGACLTVEEVGDGSVVMFVSNETRRKTNLGELDIGDFVNLEGALRASEGLDGHIVQGHIDTTSLINEIERHEEGATYWIDMPRSGAGYIASKGSITLDGISFTVAEIGDNRFSVAVIPETLKRTNLSGKEEGDTVNLEFDVLAKYVERQLQSYI